MTKDSTQKTDYYLTKKEIELLYWYHLQKNAELYRIVFDKNSGIGVGITVEIRDKPETNTDITDYGNW